MFYVEAGLFLGTSTAAVFPWRFWLHKNADELNASERSELEKTVNELAQKMGISKNLEIFEIKNLMVGAQAVGNTLLPGRAGIAIDPSLYNALNRGEAEFLISHELAHLKNHDILKFGGIILLSLIAYVALTIIFPATAIFSWSLLSSPAAFVTGVTCLVAIVFQSRMMEEQADKTGFHHCSEEGKKHAASFFQNLRDAHLTFKNGPHLSLWDKLKAMTIDSEGNFRLDISHPAISHRIRYLQWPQTQEI